MYKIGGTAIKGFVEDSSIKLPRFQRKKTWKTEQNFLLAISVFKNYPIGVVILSLDKDQNNKPVKYLLDGRQRRNALSEMTNDPEQIYWWTKKYLSIKPSDSEDDVLEKVSKSINEYISADSDLSRTSQDEATSFDEEYFNNIDISDSKGEVGDIEKKQDGVSVLLRLIKYAHNGAKGKNTGLTLKFDFTNFFERIPYYDTTEEKFDTRSLNRFINEYIKWCEDREISYEDNKNFIKFMKATYIFKQGKENAFEDKVNLNWQDILNRIVCFKDVNQIMSDSEIGVIQISNMKPIDQQKIFDLINSKGTKLTPAEVLSAKPMWNIVIANPSPLLVEETKKLYEYIKIPYGNKVVKWDICATLVNRLKDYPMFLYDFMDENNYTKEKNDAIFEKNVGLGFKILAGIYYLGVKQEEISKISENFIKDPTTKKDSLTQKINWEVDIEVVIEDLKKMFKVIQDYKYFTYFNSWKKPVMSLLSDGIGINFIIYMYKYWKAIGEPLGYNTNTKIFQKNAFILFDRLIYEYLMDQWKGSSDSKIGRNLDSIPTTTAIFEPVSKEKWESLLKDLFDNCKLNDNVVTTHSKLAPILYHYYSMKEIMGPSETIDIDHIMPQSIFTTATFPDCKTIVHNLGNLALLPKKENCSKNDRLLSDITQNESWLKQMIVKFEEIPESSFAKYSNTNNFNDLKAERRKLFEDCFSTNRDDLLNN